MNLCNYSYIVGKEKESLVSMVNSLLAQLGEES